MQNWKIYFVKIWDHENIIWYISVCLFSNVFIHIQLSSFNNWIAVLYFSINLRMDKKEAEKLSEELGKLSENEKQNIKRMKEIAHVLVQYYMWKKKK